MATYTQDYITHEQKKQEYHDILYKNKSMNSQASAKKAEPSPYVQDEAYMKRNAEEYKNNRGYFSYSPYAKNTIKQEAPVANNSQKEMPSSLKANYSEPVYKAPVQEPQYKAPVEQPTYYAPQAKPATRSIRRIEESDDMGTSYEPTYDMAPARAIAKQKLVKKTNANVDYEEDYALSLSTNMKVVLALVASIVIIAFTVIFVNSALLNSLEMETNAAINAVNQLADQSGALIASISQATGADAAANYAASVGMILG